MADKNHILVENPSIVYIVETYNFCCYDQSITTAMPDEKQIVPDMEKEAISVETAGHAPDKVILHANDADEAMKAFAGSEGEVLVLDEATNRRLLRKIDMNLMPAGISTILEPCK